MEVGFKWAVKKKVKINYLTRFLSFSSSSSLDSNQAIVSTRFIIIKKIFGSKKIHIVKIL